MSLTNKKSINQTLMAHFNNQTPGRVGMTMLTPVLACVTALSAAACVASLVSLILQSFYCRTRRNVPTAAAELGVTVPEYDSWLELTTTRLTSAIVLVVNMCHPMIWLSLCVMGEFGKNGKWFYSAPASPVPDWLWLAMFNVAVYSAGVWLTDMIVSDVAIHPSVAFIVAVLWPLVARLIPITALVAFAVFLAVALYIVVELEVTTALLPWLGLAPLRLADGVEAGLAFMNFGIASGVRQDVRVHKTSGPAVVSTLTRDVIVLPAGAVPRGDHKMYHDVLRWAENHPLRVSTNTIFGVAMAYCATVCALGGFVVHVIYGEKAWAVPLDTNWRAYLRGPYGLVLMVAVMLVPVFNIVQRACRRAADGEADKEAGRTGHGQGVALALMLGRNMACVKFGSAFFALVHGSSSVFLSRARLLVRDSAAPCRCYIRKEDVGAPKFVKN